jgi:2-methylcitrate dehydratase PrpD
MLCCILVRILKRILSCIFIVKFFSRKIKSSEMKMDRLSNQIAEYVSSVRFENLTAGAIKAAKMSTLDTVGAMLAGSRAPGVDTVLELARSWGGTGEAHVVSFGDGLPAPHAAWCNGTMARALEIDDCLDFLPVHPSASTIPALLAVAELRGGLSGKEFLAALVVAQDLITRMGLTVRQTAIQSGRMNIFRIFGPAAAIANAIGLSPKETQHALGIAFSYAIGDGQSALDGALTVRLQQGIVAQGALIAGLLASRGFTGAKDFLLGKFGYFNAFEPNPRLEYLTKDLGKIYYGERISIKPYAACRGTHAAIELALNYKKESEILSRPVKRITYRTSPEIFQFVGSPREEKIRPNSTASAQFSIQYVAAAAISRGDVFLKELEAEAILSRDILDIAERIYVEPDEALRTESAVGRTIVEVETDEGVTWEGQLEEALGSPSRPMTYEQCTDKFMKCTAHSLKPLKKEKGEELVKKIQDLENITDVSSLVALMH